MRRLRIPLLILVLALAAAVLDREAGIGRYRQLRADLVAAEARVETMKRSNQELEATLDSLDADEFAIETAIRRDLGLARPGDILVTHGRQDSRLETLP